MRKENIPINLKMSDLRFESKVYSNGKTTLPVEIKRALGVKDGYSLIFLQKGGDFIVTTRKHILEQGRKYFQSCPGKYSVDDFIADRRREVKAELEDE